MPYERPSLVAEVMYIVAHELQKRLADVQSYKLQVDNDPPIDQPFQTGTLTVGLEVAGAMFSFSVVYQRRASQLAIVQQMERALDQFIRDRLSHVQGVLRV